MLKQYLFIVLLLGHSVLGTSQITINVQLPPGGMVQKDQLWNLALINNQQAADVLVTLELLDGVSGQTVMSAAGRAFTLNKGVTVLSLKDVQPLQFNYLSAEMNGQFLPLGNYIACYRLFKADKKNPDPLGDECVNINITPLSPPVLSSPADGEVIDFNYPQFSWMPPAPVNMFNNLRYDFLIAEILPGQSARDAILQNSPVYTGHSIQTTFLQYPAAFKQLKEGQKYAWQVVAKNGMNYAAETEVWSFTLKKAENPAPAADQAAYITLTGINMPAGISYITGKELKVKYYSYDRERKAAVSIRTLDGKLIKDIQQSLIYGDNFFTLQLDKICSKGIIYRIELLDANGNKFAASFSLQ